MPHASHNNALLNDIRELVFGLEDGLVSTMGAVAGIAAGTQNGKVVVLSGAVLVAVEALSMAAGSYLSNKSHRQMLEAKIREEREEIETDPARETEELRVMYRERGFAPEEIDILIRRITSDKELWLEEMVSKELHIGTQELRDAPQSGAVVMGFSYVVAGMVPVVPFICMPVAYALPVSVSATLVALFGVGAWKAKLTGLSVVKSGLEMLVIASGAALTGYVIGRVLGNAFGLNV